MKLTLNLATRLHVDPRIVYLSHGLLLALMSAWLLLNLHYLQTVQALGEHAHADLAQLRQLEDLEEQGEGAPAEINAAVWQRLEQEIAQSNDILLREGFRWTVLLGHLEEVGINGISLRAVQPDHQAGSLRISGQARGAEALGAYLDRLLASPNFTDVYLLEQGLIPLRTPQGKDVQVIGFTLVLKGAF
jgi:hypothetical protein